MCGIVGYVGSKSATPIILNGLKNLEYRGYDSAGIAVFQKNGSVDLRREVGKLGNLVDLVEKNPLVGNIGVGHTRWATHGVPSQRNAHPHVSMDGKTVVVHNGIIENFRELREELETEGVKFTSDTDTETVVHLIDRYMASGLGLAEATRRAANQLQGSQAIVAMSANEPDKLIAVRIGNAGGVALGLGDHEMYIASDIPAILEHTRKMIFLESRQMAIVTAGGYTVMTLEGKLLSPQIHDIPWDPISAAKGEYRHFMQKEIFEQPRSLTDTLRGRIDFRTGEVMLKDLPLTADEAKSIRRLVIVACGTSYYSGLVGKFMIESLAKIPVEVEYASEYRYRDPVLGADDVLLAITQSGETVDTLAAMEVAKERNVRLWSIVNTIGSQAMRMSDGYILMQAGPEVAVASTKVYTSSIADQMLLAMYLGQLRGTLTPEDSAALARDLAHLPDLAGEILQNDPAYRNLAGKLYHHKNFLFLGRGINYPTALEGALKLKEISYIHAEGYPAGEMKHGPIALIDEHMPVLAIVLQDQVYEKMISQVEQVKSRGGIVIALATDGDTFIAEKADYVIYVPKMSRFLSPIVSVMPLQLLAYHMAVWRGADVDQPRNLAKSVTVE